MVTIVASHNVTPNEPTPNDPLWLSDSDQIGNLRHVSCFYVYKAKHDKNALERLMKSLSKILVHYYPVAGRLRLTESGRMELNCNAKGVTLVEAETTNTFADYGDFSPSLFTEELVPKVDYTQPIEDIPLMLIQLTTFDGGEGLAIGTLTSHPFSRFEAIAAHIWRCASKARASAESSNHPTLVRFSVDIRKRLNLPLPQNYFGNALAKTVTPKCNEGEIISNPLSYATQRIREAVYMVTDEYIRSQLSVILGQEQLDSIRAFFMGQGHLLNVPYAGNHNILLTSWLGMPIYEADFAWGKPMHYGLASAFQEDRAAILPSSDGDGVAVTMFFQIVLMQLFKTFFYEEL
ncbi:shikimate O-hydroxycinnamoyltransferase [Vigna unguiculata]|uniref:Shikimate O-hydroxycinnamoyltransferase n=1 Tax=Vigna unguiculata TaxID=3917 RepID=A0A4D6KLN9_VIGUN|nr:shikimate O-hydroxycinnamoyltransferase [Vigna unguiculata]